MFASCTSVVGYGHPDQDVIALHAGRKGICTLLKLSMSTE